MPDYRVWNLYSDAHRERPGDKEVAGYWHNGPDKGFTLAWATALSEWIRNYGSNCEGGGFEAEPLPEVGPAYRQATLDASMEHHDYRRSYRHEYSKPMRIDEAIICGTDCAAGHGRSFMYVAFKRGDSYIALGICRVCGKTIAI